MATVLGPALVAAVPAIIRQIVQITATITIQTITHKIRLATTHPTKI